LSPRDSSAAHSAFGALPSLPRNDNGPVFAEPWQASAFAVAVSLSQQGHFSWKEWAAALAEELKSSTERGEPDDGTHYYHCWLATLERVVVAKGLSESAELRSCREAWADAYRRTPHGQPVQLKSALSGS
jgi:nitrile hydratase accessory protein